MNLLSDPLAQLAAAEAEWELRRDYSVVLGIAQRVNDLLVAGPTVSITECSAQDGSARQGSAGWLGPARRAFDGREAELLGTLRLAASEIEALAAELQAAIQLFAVSREP